MNKYEIKEFEQHLFTLIQPLTGPGVIETHLKANLSASDVLRIAKQVGQPSIADTARSIILARLWAKESSTSPYETLRLGESLDDKAIIGASYYQILLFGWRSWSSVEGLTSDHRRNLTSGMIKCGDEWQILSDSLGNSQNDRVHPMVHQDCRKKYLSGGTVMKKGKGKKKGQDVVPVPVPLPAPVPVPWNLWDNLARSELPWFDLMGRIDITIKESPLWGCQSSCSDRYAKEVEKIKSNLYLYFEAERGLMM